MSSLHIVIGFNGPQKSCPPQLVYMGSVPSESLKAMDASTCLRFVVLRNPHGYGKNNPHAKANLAKAAATPAPVSAPVITAEALAALQAEAAEAAGLKAELAAVKARAEKTPGLFGKLFGNA